MFGALHTSLSLVLGIACQRNIVTQTRGTAAGGVHAIFGHAARHDEPTDLHLCGGEGAENLRALTTCHSMVYPTGGYLDLTRLRASLVSSRLSPPIGNGCMGCTGTPAPSSLVLGSLRHHPNWDCGIVRPLGAQIVFTGSRFP